MDKTARLRLIRHSGAEIKLLDFSHLADTDESLEVIAYFTSTLSQEAPASQLVLYDLDNCMFNKTSLAEMEKFYAAVGSNIIAAAVIGVEGMMKIIATNSARNSPRPVELFDDRTAALDWLVTHV